MMNYMGSMPGPSPAQAKQSIKRSIKPEILRKYRIEGIKVTPKIEKLIDSSIVRGVDKVAKEKKASNNTPSFIGSQMGYVTFGEKNLKNSVRQISNEDMKKLKAIRKIESKWLSHIMNPHTKAGKKRLMKEFENLKKQLT